MTKRPSKVDVEEGDDALEGEDRELTEEDVEAECGPLPVGWPPHGIKIVNNMRARFPEYPLEGIVLHCRQQNFIGGQVMHAIRKTGALEVETGPVAVKIGRSSDFPAL